MARKKNGLERHSPNNKKGVLDSGSAPQSTKGKRNVSQKEVVTGDDLPNGNQTDIPLTEDSNTSNHPGEEKKRRHKGLKSQRKDKKNVAATQELEQSVLCDTYLENCTESGPTTAFSGSGEEIGISPHSNHEPRKARSSFRRVLNGFPGGSKIDNMEFADEVFVDRLRIAALSFLKTSTEWLERKRPLFIAITTSILNARDYVCLKIGHAYPILLGWIVHLGSIMLLLSMVWLDCALRGMDSLLRMGTTSFFAVLWFSILSIIAMVGMFKFLLVVAIAAAIAFLFGFTIAVLLVAICGIVILWLYGSFWTTLLVIFIGGLAFSLSHERLALLFSTVYSVYCAWAYVGWLGLLLGLNLSFFTSDALIFFLKNNISEHRTSNSRPEQTAGMRAEPGFFSGECAPTDRGPGIPSTSCSDAEMTSEDEVLRLLNCKDHYSALGFSQFENIDVSILKREYRKKAILVHPDKNMGNEKAAEAFKKLQNAYEVLLDSFKRKSYDDELRREELLNCFRRFQNASQKGKRHGFFHTGFSSTESDGEDPFGESRRIACRKCDGYHLWIHTKKSKSRARWCQDCKDFHQAKDGDGWVEQSSRPYLFGILQKINTPSAYVCADSKVYDATEWYICQGMRCPVNTHKPSFHVNTSVTSKHNNGKGTSSGQRSSGMPASNLEEAMTEEEFFEWLQNALQSGMFENFAGSKSEPMERGGNSSKSGGSGSGCGNSSGSKKKKKGKKQW